MTKPNGVLRRERVRWRNEWTHTPISIDPFAGSGVLAIQLSALCQWAGATMTLVGIAAILAAFGKMVKDVCTGIATLWPPK